ncbi:hypothetical protein GUITHDRAFT_108946 [Guillardia theta CCMP2712]|uniref:Uncharacterized protein n=1 Tax=Guillardia theta (strain CCMP2712) TaxID=905079 RepID=L1JAJ0_GUITC|nr:hypothetical protein GUITHDRAFT_108946 [Guillardia theta CCMP2712]EKX45307.1 hypothetical protein GUITHDRAFT_108946 [Guillardia theta CCMP2712]|eukprot:XP_005832287.1 hypothetical protein GUITHDRAFT_108946 [Guillardia theta CCMP2712]
MCKIQNKIAKAGEKHEISVRIQNPVRIDVKQTITIKTTFRCARTIRAQSNVYNSELPPETPVDPKPQRIRMYYTRIEGTDHDGNPLITEGKWRLESLERFSKKENSLESDSGVDLDELFETDLDDSSSSCAKP